MSSELLFWMLSALAVVGAGNVLLATDVMRLGLGLGGFLLALAGFFALYGFGLLALAEVFVYVGGVLVLVIFAIMLVHREQPGSPRLQARHDPLAAVASVGVAALLAAAVRPLAASGVAAADSSVDAVGTRLLGAFLPHFEVAGLLLLAALVAVVSLGGGDGE